MVRHGELGTKESQACICSGNCLGGRTPRCGSSRSAVTIIRGSFGAQRWRQGQRLSELRWLVAPCELSPCLGDVKQAETSVMLCACSSCFFVCLQSLCSAVWPETTVQWLFRYLSSAYRLRFIDKLCRSLSCRICVNLHAVPLLLPQKHFFLHIDRRGHPQFLYVCHTIAVASQPHCFYHPCFQNPPLGVVFHWFPDIDTEGLYLRCSLLLYLSLQHHGALQLYKCSGNVKRKLRHEAEAGFLCGSLMFYSTYFFYSQDILPLKYLLLVQGVGFMRKVLVISAGDVCMYELSFHLIQLLWLSSWGPAVA